MLREHVCRYYIALPLTCLPAEIFSRDPFTSNSSDLAYAKRASALVNPNASPNARQTLVSVESAVSM